jgi:hypothetical protein
MENRQKGIRNSFCARKVQGYAAEAKIYYAGAMRGLVGEDGVSICSGHRNAFGLSRDSEDARFLNSEWKGWPRGF